MHIVAVLIGLWFIGFICRKPKQPKASETPPPGGWKIHPSQFEDLVPPPDCGCHHHHDE